MIRNGPRHGLTCERGALKSGLKLERHYYQSAHRGSLDTMTDHSFEIGDTVVDREDPSAAPAVVVALPARTAGEWLMYSGVTVARANPGYPADAPIVVVVAATDVGRYLPDWDAETSLSRTALTRRGSTIRRSLPPDSPLPGLTNAPLSTRTLPLIQRNLPTEADASVSQ